MIEIGAKFGNGWSFDGVCKKCGENSSQCKCNKKTEILVPEQHLLKIFVEKRKNKVVTLAKEFFLTQESEKALLKRIKKTLGRGGSFKNSALELQGEVKEKLKQELIKEGFKVK